MSVRRWMLVVGLLLALSGGLILVNRPAVAASAGCSAVGGALTSVSGAPYDNTESRQYTGDFVAGEVISASATGVDTSNPVAIALTVNGTAGNPFTISLDGNYTVVAATDNLPEQANVTVSCNAPPPTATPTATLTPVPASPTKAPSSTPLPSATPWPGYTDGRLGADPAEYYSLWCSGNSLNVWSSVSGRGVQQAAIPLRSLIGQVVGTSAPYVGANGPLLVTRSSSDTFLVQGNTGNSAPNPGVKAFSLAACIAANGAPVATPTATLLVRTVLPTRTPTVAPSSTPTPLPTWTVDPAVDADGDGVRDGVDLCKYEPGPANGCPDPDGDGIGGPLDLCPESAGPIGARGCPDTDGDGVYDALDACPNFAGAFNAYGCPDNDGDGIPNAIDWCPVQVPEAQVNQFQGCNDFDSDGFVNGAMVPDWFVDDCPDVNGVNYMNGCPPPTAFAQPTVDYMATLTVYANQQEGQFTPLILQNAQVSTTCSAGMLLFCVPQ